MRRRELQKQWLKVLGREPVEPAQRVGLARGRVFCAPDGLAPVAELTFRRIQGKDLSGSYGVKLLVRLTARTVGLGTEIADERWFDLEAGDFDSGPGEQWNSRWR